MQRTLEFEEELAEKFGGGGHNRETGIDIEETERGNNNGQAVLDIRKKYEKKLGKGSGNEVLIRNCLIVLTYHAAYGYLVISYH